MAYLHNLRVSANLKRGKTPKSRRNQGSMALLRNSFFFLPKCNLIKPSGCRKNLNYGIELLFVCVYREKENFFDKNKPFSTGKIKKKIKTGLPKSGFVESFFPNKYFFESRKIFLEIFFQNSIVYSYTLYIYTFVYFITFCITNVLYLYNCEYNCIIHFCTFVYFITFCITKIYLCYMNIQICIILVQLYNNCTQKPPNAFRQENITFCPNKSLKHLFCVLLRITLYRATNEVIRKNKQSKRAIKRTNNN